MDRRRHAPATPPALLRMVREDRTVIWPHLVGDPLADDGRDDATIFVRRDLVKRALAARSTWDVLPEPEPRGIGRVLERIGRWLW